MADFRIEDGLGGEDGLSGVADGGDYEQERGDAGSVPAGDSGELDGGVLDKIVAPIADVFPGIGKEVFFHELRVDG